MKKKTPQVVEVRNPRSFGRRYGQQLSRDAVEQFREVIRQERAEQERTQVARTERSAQDIASIPASSTTFPASSTAPVTIPAIPKAQEKLKVAYYARVSSLMASQQTSIDNQEIHFEDAIKANPEWEFAGAYIDQGVTGTRAEIRPELQRLLQDCQDGKIDRILTKSISRLARNLTDCLEIVRTLKDLGVAVYFEREKIDTGKMGSEFILSMYACLAEEESHSISGNVKWSIRKRFQNGTYQQPLTPYGYQLIDGKMEIVKEEAAIVRRIYDMVLSGNGMKSIARTLNQEQIPSPTGGAWTDSTLRKLVANPVYTGDMLYQRTYRNDRFQQVPNKGELDQYYDSGHHEPIITREMFENAKTAVAERAKLVGYSDVSTNNRSGKRYPFTGILRCQVCGETMHRQVWKEPKNTAWICHRHVVHPDFCTMKPQSELDLKRAFVNCLNKLAWSQRSTTSEHRLLDQYEAMLGKTEAEKNEEQLQDIDARLEVNRRESRKLMAEVMRERFRPEHREKKARLDQEAKDLLMRKNQILIQGSSISGSGNISGVGNGTLQELKKFVSNWRMSEDVTDFPEEDFTNFVEDCTVLSGKMVTFHFCCGLKLTESLYKVEISDAVEHKNASKQNTSNKEDH